MKKIFSSVILLLTLNLIARNEMVVIDNHMADNLYAVKSINKNPLEDRQYELKSGHRTVFFINEAKNNAIFICDKKTFDEYNNSLKSEVPKVVGNCKKFISSISRKLIIFKDSLSICEIDSLSANTIRKFLERFSAEHPDFDKTTEYFLWELRRN